MLLFINKIADGIKDIVNLFSPVRDTCEFYCGAEPYAVVEGNTKICKSCFGRLGNLFKKSDVVLV